jgi:hypothetical protein
MLKRTAFFVPGFILFVAACSSNGAEMSSSDDGVKSDESPGGAGSDGNSGAPGGGPGSPGGPDTGGSQGPGGQFPKDAVWNQDVSSAKVAADSSAITAWMKGFKPPHGWGSGTMKVDFSMTVVNVPAATPKRTFQTVNGYYYVPDCDHAPVPVPKGGAVEATYGTPTDFSGPVTGYNCAGFPNGDDCHMLFVAPSEQRVYEIYHATIDSNDNFQGGCLAIWDTAKAYDVNGRGQQCSSADAAGLPVTPLLFTADEIAAGAIDHAIRFILPNDMIRKKKYVSPATHGTNTTGPTTSIPYGARLRLRADYPLATLSPAAQVVAKALQKYGMIHADGGNIALTAQSDALSNVKWADVGFDASSLSALDATDFEVLDYGAPFDVTFDCQRKQITQ